MIFQTIASSISETAQTHGKTWQAIILEHAGDDIYGNIEGINILEPWRNRKALIPHGWYDDEENTASA